MKATIDFHLAEKVLYGQGEDVVHLIDQTSTFLECRLQNWRTELETKRLRHRYLNYFTNAQIVTLSEQLAALSPNKHEWQAATYALLSKLYMGVTTRDLLAAIQEAQESICRVRKTSAPARTSVHSSDAANQLREILDLVLPLGFTRQLINAAIDAVGPQNKSKGEHLTFLLATIMYSLIDKL